jgi:hypothetical protein
MIEGTPLFSETQLPAPPHGWFDYGYRVLMDGRLALIRTRNDVHAIWREWGATEKANSPLYSIPHPDIWAPDAEWQDWYRAVQTAYAARPPAYRRLGQGFGVIENEIRVSIFDGARETEPVILPNSHDALLDRTADGHWLVISRAANEINGSQVYRGTLYAPDGSRVARLPLGHGIERILCSPDGTIWAGYGNQSIYDTPDEDGGPLSRGGLVRFDSRGAPIWAFNGNVVHKGIHVYLHDCPVMTLSGSTLWTSVPHRMVAEEPSILVRVGNGTLDLFASALDDGREIAVAGDKLIVAGFHDEDANRILTASIGKAGVGALGRLRVDQVARAGSLSLRWPAHLIQYRYEFEEERETAPRLLEGRDGILHAVTRGTWLRLNPEYAARAADAADIAPYCRVLSGGWTVYPPSPPSAAPLGAG